MMHQFVIYTQQKDLYECNFVYIAVAETTVILINNTHCYIYDLNGVMVRMSIVRLSYYCNQQGSPTKQTCGHPNIPRMPIIQILN